MQRLPELAARGLSRGNSPESPTIQFWLLSEAILQSYELYFVKVFQVLLCAWRGDYAGGMRLFGLRFV